MEPSIFPIKIKIGGFFKTNITEKQMRMILNVLKGKAGKVQLLAWITEVITGDD